MKPAAKAEKALACTTSEPKGKKGLQVQTCNP